MNYASIANVLGTLLIVTGSSMALPLAYSLYFNEGDLFSILISAIITVALGLPLWWLFRKNQELNIKDGYFHRGLWMDFGLCRIRACPL